MKKALITGITGQDGSFLAELLLAKGYEVYGLIRRSSSFNLERIEHLYIEQAIEDMHTPRGIYCLYGDMTDSESLIRLIHQIEPDEIYNLAAQSHVKISFEVPEYTADTDAVGVLRILEAVRFLGLEKKCRIYQASTSELFWPRARDTAEGDHAVLPALAIRRSQALRLLDRAKLPRKLRDVRL